MRAVLVGGVRGLMKNHARVHHSAESVRVPFPASFAREGRFRRHPLVTLPFAREGYAQLTLSTKTWLTQSQPPYFFKYGDFSLGDGPFPRRIFFLSFPFFSLDIVEFFPPHELATELRQRASRPTPAPLNSEFV